jgi:hypothetical protein
MNELSKKWGSFVQKTASLRYHPYFMLVFGNTNAMRMWLEEYTDEFVAENSDFYGVRSVVDGPAVRVYCSEQQMESLLDWQKKSGLRSQPLYVCKVLDV